MGIPDGAPGDLTYVNARKFEFLVRSLGFRVVHTTKSSVQSLEHALIQADPIKFILPGGEGRGEGSACLVFC